MSKGPHDPRRAAAQRKRRCERIEQAAREVSRTWDEWMQEEDGDGPFEPVIDAIGELREALGERVGNRTPAG